MKVLDHHSNAHTEQAASHMLHVFISNTTICLYVCHDKIRCLMVLFTACTDLHEDWTLQGATRTLPTPVLRWPVTSQEQKVYIWQAVMLSHIQELQLDIAISALRVVPVNHFTSYVHLP